MRIRRHETYDGRVAWRAFLHEGARVSRFAPDLWKEMDALARSCADRWEGLGPAEIDELRPARELYRSAGVDPTRRRPASEALLRRVLKGKDLHRINAAVDACNYCSLSFLLPIGLYDADRIEGEIALVRPGAPGESYRGLGKDRVNLEGHIVLADAGGPFGHPSGDSFRTRVELSTTRLLWVVFAPASMDGETLDGHEAFARRAAVRWCGGLPAPLES